MSQSRQSDDHRVRGTTPLRIACAVPAYSPHVSGSEVYAQAVCEALVKRGHDVRVICEASDCADFTGQEELLDGVRVWRGIGARRGLFEKMRSRLKRLGSSQGRALAKRQAFQYEAALQATDPDVVLALPVPRQSVVGAARFAARTGCPTLVVPFYHVAYDRFVNDATSWLELLGSVTAVVASSAVEQSFLEAGGIRPSRLRRPGMFVRRLPTPTPEAIRDFRDRLGVGSGFLIVSAAAEFSEPKGSLALARAAVALPQMTFVLLGGTPSSRAWLERSAPLSANVRMIGFVSEHEKAIALAAADVFALPSRADSFGIAYQEAHSLGTPSLALDLPVMREVIGPAGVFVDPKEGELGIARVLAELARQPEQLRQAAKASLEVAARYAPERILPRICDLVEEVAARPAGSGQPYKRARRDRSHTIPERPDRSCGRTLAFASR